VKNILLLNGPNLGLLGKREPEIYGTTTLHDIEEACQKLGARLGMIIATRHSNHEGELIDWLNAAFGRIHGVIINPGGLSHTSISLRDALALLKVPVIEVHLSNIHEREEFRRFSYISDIAAEVIMGHGAKGYEMAVEAMARHLQSNP
jgi:3-dehydroquinate dehydratase-2